MNVNCWGLSNQACCPYRAKYIGLMIGLSNKLTALSMDLCLHYFLRFYIPEYTSFISSSHSGIHNMCNCKAQPLNKTQYLKECLCFIVTPKLHKEGKNVACVCMNSTRFST